MKKKTKEKTLKIIGWREQVSLPDLKIKKIKAKVDTGARTSALHAFDMNFYKRKRSDFVKFKIHPEQHSENKETICRAKILEYRKVTSSNGQSELRPVILTTINLLGEIWQTELTLTNRDKMEFKMLLGRKSIKKKFLVDSGKSFIAKKR